MLGIDPGYIFWMFKVVRALFNIVEWILDKATGHSITHGPLEERQSRGDKAHVVRIIGRSAYHSFTWHNLTNFLYLHDSYVDPVSILEQEHITLHGMDEKHVWFCVTDPHENVYDMSVLHFVYALQFMKARKLIIMSHSQVCQVAEVAKDKKYCHDWELIVTNSARCGSTLLCQMLDQLSDTRVISEPWALVYAHMLKNKGQDPGNDVLKAVLRLQMRKTPGSTDKRVVVKLPMFCCPLIPFIASASPSTYLMFLTRNPKESCGSSLKVMEFYDGNLYEKFDSRNFWFSCLAVPHDNDFYRKLYQKYLKKSKSEHTSFSLCVALSYVSSIACYDISRSSFDHVLTYENLIKDPDREMQELNDKLGMVAPKSQLTKAKTALKRDSQKNMFNKTRSTTKMYSDFIDDSVFNEIFREFRVPIRIGMDYAEFERFIFRG